jgi:hypothetical protein
MGGLWEGVTISDEDIADVRREMWGNPTTKKGIKHMERTIADLSAEEFEKLVERAVDRRLEVWLTQLMDALIGSQEEEGAGLDPAFAASLRRSLEQAHSGQGTDLKAFRERIGR